MIESNKFYPRSARRKTIEGRVRIVLTLGRDGRIEDLRLEGGHKLLRKAAKKAVERSLPLPDVPDALAFPLKIAFAMKYGLE